MLISTLKIPSADLTRTASLLTTVLLIVYLAIIELSKSKKSKKRNWQVFYPVISILIAVFVLALVHEFSQG